MRLGFSLTPVGREAEAAGHLEAALAMARQLGDHEQEVAAYGTGGQVHYLLHHRGRCYAEQGQAADARRCLEQALVLRQQLGNEALIASSQGALADLAG